MNRKRGFLIALWAVLLVITGCHGPGGIHAAPWHGGGRMGGWDDRCRMDGVPGGYGMGPGMGAGMGPGMPGGGYAAMPGQLPELTPEQSQKIGQMQADSAQRDRSLIRQRREAQSRLDDLYAADTRDWNAIRATARTVLDLQRQQQDAAIDLQQKIDALLTDRQRHEMARGWRGSGWMGAQ